ncbi:PGF-pre-PGF domain-containing protein [Methanomethylovorans sp.]|uniref:PGF-pre-PGF domain-containing protein n=1 Tax=Methanomethylovorans sp. TaxID=2758717 RepID=UPI001BD5890F
MQLKLSGSIYLGAAVILMLLISGISAAEELKVDLVSQYNGNTYDTISITNAITGQDFVSHRGGSISTVVVKDDYAYVGQGQDLLILDLNVSEAPGPVEVGRVTTPAIVTNIVISGGHAYVADGQGGLVAVDITDPGASTISGTIGSIFGSGITVSGNYAYMASGYRGLVTVDISDPTDLESLSTIGTSGYAYDVAVNGSFAYVADGDNGLVVFDLTNPGTPSIIGNCSTSGSARSIAVSGNYAYIADGANGLAILNITVPAAPTITETYDTAGFARDVTLSEDHAYIADGTNGLIILNVTDPESPVLAGTHNIASSEAFCVDVSGNRSYVAYGRSGLSVLDISNPSSPTSVATFDATTGFANGVVLSDYYAYVANGLMGLMVVNVTDPALPTGAGNCATDGYAHDLAVSGGHAYIADGRGGLVVVDISDPSRPTRKGSCPTSDQAFDVAISGNYAYVAANSSGLSIIGIGDPSNPTLIDSHSTATSNTTSSANGVAVKDNYAYVADGSSGLVIMNITNPDSVEVVGSYNTTHANGVTVKDNYAYIADGRNGLVVLNITDQTNPTFTGRGNTSYAHDLVISGNYVYVADDSQGIVIFNATNPAEPIQEGSYITAGYAYDVAVANNYVYVADFGNGLVILSVEGADDTTPPAQISGLNATITGADWIRWSWTNPIDADFSHVMVYLDGEFVANTTDSSINFYNATDLSEGTTYTIGILTVDTSGNINPTWVNDSATPTSIVTDTMPPASVTNLTKTDSGPSWINWAWDNPADDDFSHVMVYLDGEFVANTTDSSINFYNATNLSEGTTYTIGILTVDTSGNINSTMVNDSAIAMSLPKINSVSGTDITRNSITVIWEASNDTAQVQISRDNTILENVSGSTSYVDNDLSSGTTYVYTLVPYNSDGLAGIAVSKEFTTRSSGGGGGGSSRGSSSGSGGASVSVEDFTNLALKDANTQYLRMNANVTYQFTREGNPIQSVSFYSLKNMGGTTATIEVLNNISKLANVAPEGSIYKYVNIWVGKTGFATPANIKDSKIRFKVNTSWIQQMNVDPENVQLQRYNGTAWEVLPTTMESSTADYVIYESQTPGFSPFVITAEEMPEPPVIETPDVQSNVTNNVTDNVTPPSVEEPKTPGFEALFAVVGLLAVAYLVRRN